MSVCYSQHPKPFYRQAESNSDESEESSDEASNSSDEEPVFSDDKRQSDPFSNGEKEDNEIVDKMEVEGMKN